MKRGVDLVFDGVATERLDPGVERRLPLHQLLEFIRLGRGHRLVDLLELRLDRMQGIEGPRGRLLHGVAGNELRMLAEMADPDASCELHRAMVGLELARDDAEKCALSRSVPADEPDLLAGLDGQRRTVEDGPGREGVSDACEGEERHGIAECSDVVAVNSRGLPDPVRRPPRGDEASASSVPEG